jgi:Guanylate-kinase-associated protein (GKAP) protein
MFAFDVKLQKLPQFGQLLYSYLSKESNPTAVLPCDLQGWWDVAAISIEKVKARFNEFHELRKNGWKKVEPVRPPVNKNTVNKVFKSMKKSEAAKSSASESSGLAKSKPAQASSALRQFLASKNYFYILHEIIDVYSYNHILYVLVCVSKLSF